MEKEGLITLKMLFIDDTKIEANANRYTFVWRGTVNYHLAGLLDTIDSLYQKYNALIDENEYGMKYNIPHAQMSCCMPLEEISINIIVFFMMKSKNSKEKQTA